MSKESFPLSDRVKKMQTSSTLKVFFSCRAVTSRRCRVIDLGAGEPDFPTPDNVKQAGYRAIETNQTRYTANTGTVALRTAISQYLERETGSVYPTRADYYVDWWKTIDLQCHRYDGQSG